MTVMPTSQKLIVQTLLPKAPEKSVNDLNKVPPKLVGKEVIDPQRIPLPKAKCYQKENLMRILGIALIALGCLPLLAGSAAVATGYIALTTLELGLCVGAALCAAGAITAIAIGIFLLKKEYWNDQAFVDKITTKIQNLPFDQIIQQYGFKRTSEQSFISKANLTKKFQEKIRNESLSYQAVHLQFGEMIRQYKFIDWHALNPLLMKEINDEEMNIDAYKKRYGNQPLIDGVFDINDPWYTGETLNGIKDKNYAAIKDAFQLEINRGILPPEAITKELISQYLTQSSIEAFIHQQGGAQNFWQIVKDGILQPGYFSQDLKQQTSNMPIKEIVSKFGWNIFETGMILGQSLRSRFASDEKDTPFSEVLQKFGGQETGWNIFNYGLAEPRMLKINALREISQKKMDFEQILSTYTWKAFSFGILHGEDPEIRSAFIQMAGKNTFCSIWENYSQAISTYELLPPISVRFMSELTQRKALAEATFKEDVNKHKILYDNAIQHALQHKEKEIALAQKNIHQLKELISNENKRFSNEKIEAETRIRNLRAELLAFRKKIGSKITGALPDLHVQPGHRSVSNQNPSTGDARDLDIKTDPKDRVIPGERKNNPSQEREERHLITLILQLERRLIEAAESHEIILRPLQVQLSLSENQYVLIEKAARVNYKNAIQTALQKRNENDEACKGILIGKKATLDAEFAIHYLNNLQPKNPNPHPK